MNRRITLDNKCVNHIYNSHDRSGRMHVDFINDGVYRPYRMVNSYKQSKQYHDQTHHHHTIQTGGNDNDIQRDNTLDNTLDNTNTQNTDLGQISSESDPDTYMNELNDLIDSPLPDQMIGGANSLVFRSGYTMYMIADAIEPKLINAYRSRLDKLGISRVEQSKIKPHISLLQVQINKANPDHHQLVGSTGKIRSNLERHLENAYKILSPQMYLISRKGKYEIMGEFMAKVYKAINSTYITSFRMSLYKYLEHKLGPSTRKIAILNGKKYFVYAYGGRDLIAIPEYYHGKGVWTPHLSLIKLDKLQKANPHLFNAYQKSNVGTLINALTGVKGTIDQVNLGYHFGSFRTSVI